MDLKTFLDKMNSGDELETVVGGVPAKKIKDVERQ